LADTQQPYRGAEAAPDVERPSQGEVDLLLVDRAVDAVEAEDPSALSDLLESLHPADIADIFEQLSNDQLRKAVSLIPGWIDGDVLAELEENTRALVLEELEPHDVARAIADLDSDDAIEVVEQLDPDAREEVLAASPDTLRAELERGLAHDEDTVGRLMQRDFVAAPDFWSVGDAIDHMREAGERLPELFFELYIVGPDFKPVGEIPVSRLLREPRDKSLSELMQPPPVLIPPEMDQEEAAFLFQKYHLISAPVVDEAGRLTGMLTVDDMVDVIQEENKEDMLALAGVSEAGLSHTVLESVRSRAPWLLLNTVTAVLAAFVISLFSNTIEQVVALAFLMPVVASMGGNTGTQSLAVAVRAIAARELTSTNARRIVLRELFTGLVNGLIFAAVLGVVAVLWQGMWELGLVIAAAMIINLTCAGLSGILVPLALKRVGADPAVASSIFVTAVTDVVGFFAFLGLATMVLL
jgi:magnesium transporter